MQVPSRCMGKPVSLGDPLESKSMSGFEMVSQFRLLRGPIDDPEDPTAAVVDDDHGKIARQIADPEPIGIIEKGNIPGNKC